MPRYRLTVQYDGTEFCGWQVQPNGRTVQGMLEEAIARLNGSARRVTAAGRTDAGVHASGQVVAITLDRPFPPDTLLRALNALTPADVTVTAAVIVDDRFDPRRDASSRVYTYRIWNRPWPSPFWRRFAWHVPRTLDVAAMRAAAAVLVGEHDFSAFRAAGCDAAHARRVVHASAVERRDAMVTYTVEANAFLRCMVRNLVGTLVEIGLGTRPVTDVERLLAQGDRTAAGVAAPPHGLVLVRVAYDRVRP